MPKIVVFPGDGVGPEVTTEAVKVLRSVEQRFGQQFDLETLAIGGDALDRFGVPLRVEDVEVARSAEAALLGAVGGPRWDTVEAALRPERGLLQIRQALGLFANLRPVSVHPALAGNSPLKPEIIDGVDMLVVRELTGGIYFGKPSRRFASARGRSAVDTLRYREDEIERVVRLAFQLAHGRRGMVASVDKSNVLQSSRLWREIVDEVRGDYPDVELEHVLVDAMAMHLIKSPARFDVIVTENMFGDILTDEASVLPGSIGVLPSASLSQRAGRASGTRFGLYEPIHGSAPDIAGAGKANPAGAILSAAMLLRWSLGLDDAAMAVEAAVGSAIRDGVRTPDIARAGEQPVTTSVFGDDVARRIAEK
ncbi:MAG TPA: 3-isopropylmalate dehydrogenase [Burkholderiaceae bacterium]|nr:3-isopropylmalate dehydrogenase [Burkholderiaceae bacterium]